MKLNPARVHTTSRNTGNTGDVRVSKIIDLRLFWLRSTEMIASNTREWSRSQKGISKDVVFFSTEVKKKANQSLLSLPTHSSSTPGERSRHESRRTITYGATRASAYSTPQAYESIPSSHPYTTLPCLHYVEAPPRHVDMYPPQPTPSPTPGIRHSFLFSQSVQLLGQRRHSPDPKELEHHKSPARVTSRVCVCCVRFASGEKLRTVDCYEIVQIGK